MWFPAVGLIAASVGMTVSIPQVVRLLRSPHADGVSFNTALLGALAAATWLAYGVALLDPPQILANVPGLAGAVAVAVLVARRTGVAGSRTLLIVAAWAAVATLTYLVGGPVALGMAATSVALVRQWPQLLRAFQPGSLAALSPVSYLLSITSATLWVAYGIGMGQPPVWICSMVSLVISSAVLVQRCRPRSMGALVAA